MFNALKNGRQGAESSHDVYCSQCGLLTNARSNNKAEGWNPDILSAGVSLPCIVVSIELTSIDDPAIGSIRLPASYA